MSRNPAALQEFVFAKSKFDKKRTTSWQIQREKKRLYIVVGHGSVTGCGLVW